MEQKTGNGPEQVDAWTGVDLWSGPPAPGEAWFSGADGFQLFRSDVLAAWMRRSDVTAQRNDSSPQRHRQPATLATAAAAACGTVSWLVALPSPEHF